MVFLNYSTMQMVAKIVYYGPGLGGKTTNLKTIYKNTDERSRGEMVSLATETDRTLFFDLLPMEVGVIGGFKTKFQLYTVPGQVFYNTTRKLVLRGVDGIVFVADSQLPMMDANRESFNNLEENLKELNLTVRDVPLVIQFNKRDLPNVASVEEMNRVLNPMDCPTVEASALNGVGVFETLREISKQTLLILNQKSQGNQLKEASARTEPPKQEPSAPVLPDEPGQAPPEIEDSDTFTELADPDMDGEDKDNFEKTLENMELDFDDDDDLDTESLDMSEFEDWEDDSLKDVVAEQPNPVEAEAASASLDDSVPELKIHDKDDAQVPEESRAIANAYLQEMSAEDDEDLDPFAFDDNDEAPPSPAASDPGLEDDPEPDLDLEPLPDDQFMLGTEPSDSADFPPPSGLEVDDDDELLPIIEDDDDDELEAIDDSEVLENLESLDEFAPIEHVVDEVRASAEEPLDREEEILPALEEETELPEVEEEEVLPAFEEETELSEAEEEPSLPTFEEEAELSEAEEEPSLSVIEEELSEEEPEPPASEPEPVPTPEAAAPAPARKPRAASIDASLADLKTMTSRISTRTISPKKKQKASVDDLLTGLVDDKKTGKMERKSIKVKAPFDHAQLNCVFLDEDENVIDTHLLKVETHELKDGRRRIKVSIDIDVG